MEYKFRLTAHSGIPGVFNIAEPSLGIDLPGGRKLEIYPRDADTLDKATKYHFDCGGFVDEVSARQSGEKLRQALRFLTTILDLQLVVPSEDKETGWVHDDVKRSVREAGGEVLNTRSGLCVFPDDGKTLEFVSSASATVRIGKPEKVFRAAADLWQRDIEIDERSIRALEILSLSAAETSIATKFLLTYLVIEHLIPVEPRTQEAKKVLGNLKDLVQASSVEDSEKRAMLGFIAGMEKESFRAAWKRYISRIEKPADVEGIPLDDLVSRAVALRNQVAHKVIAADSTELQTVTRALRRFALSVIWTANQLPAMTIDRPADTVTINQMEVRIL